MFVFEDIPYGVPGNTGDVNIASIYASDTISLLPEGGMRLSCFMAPEDYKIFMQGWNGTWNANYRSDVSLWTWHAPKVTTRMNGRFQYGMIETRIKAPKGYGNWPAAWLNGCYGFIAESSGEFLLQEDYPFLCGQYGCPSSIEHFSPDTPGTLRAAQATRFRTREIRTSHHTSPLPSHHASPLLPAFCAGTGAPTRCPSTHPTSTSPRQEDDRPAATAPR